MSAMPSFVLPDFAQACVPNTHQTEEGDTMKKCFVLLSILIGFCLAACSSSDNDAPAGSSTRTGVFKDSNVSGLAFVSGNQSGYTNANGQFTYESGQTVTFAVGGVTIGSATGSSVITPLDLVPGSTTASSQVQNIIRFLMMLDEDGNPDNGITISESTRAAAQTWAQVNFATTDLASELDTIISSAMGSNPFAETLPDESTAKAHFESTLRCTYAGAFEGSYSGGDRGTFGFIVDALTGYVYGIAYSITGDELMSISGSTPIGYSQNPSFISGNVSGGTTYQGQFSSPDRVSGSWENDIYGYSGTFSGSRIGGASDALYRYTGQFSEYSGDDLGVIAFDVNSANRITGIAYSVDEDTVYNLTGTLSGKTVNVTLSNNATASGTLDVTTGQMSGTWSAPDGSSGVFSGCGCKLN